MVGAFAKCSRLQLNHSDSPCSSHEASTWFDKKLIAGTVRQRTCIPNPDRICWVISVMTAGDPVIQFLHFRTESSMCRKLSYDWLMFPSMFWPNTSRPIMYTSNKSGKHGITFYILVMNKTNRLHNIIGQIRTCERERKIETRWVRKQPYSRLHDW